MKPGQLLLAGLLVLSSAVAHANCVEKCMHLERRGTELADLIWEFEQHAPLKLDPRSAFEFVIAEGTVVAVEPIETGQEDWSPAHSCYPAWAEARIDVSRAVAVHSDVETTAGAWTFVERHRFFRDDRGNLFEVWWGKGRTRYNHLLIGDRVIVAGVRNPGCEDSCFFYSPEFCPHFSVVFNVMVRGDDVCVDKPWQCASEGHWDNGRLVNGVSPEEVIPREEHCYSVSPDEAFDAIVEAVRAGSPPQPSEER